MLKNNNILFKKDNEQLFWNYWQKLIVKESYRYLPLNIKTNISISKNSSLFHKDRSFVYLLNKEPVAGILLPIEKGKDGFSASIAGNYVAAPLIADHFLKIRDEIFSLIDKIAVENDIQKIMFEIDPLSGDLYNYLQEYDYLDASILNYIIDLELDNLFNSCRRNHKRNISRILKNKDFSVFWIDKDNPSRKIHEEYRQLHHKCSGRITRPKETFDFQFEKLKQDNAALFGLKYKCKNIAFVYFEFNSNKAVSFSAADDPKYDNFPLYHVLYYSGMEYLKRKGIKAIDTGQPSCPSSQFDYYLDEKKSNIVHFKRGFGGFFANNFRGVKYFSKELFKQEAEKFKNDYFLHV